MRAISEQQLKRLQTLLDATSYSFPLEDAKGFPNALPPARKIGLGRRSLTGLMTSGQKVEGPGPFESSLERDYYVLLEFDVRVFAWHPQPLKVVTAKTEERPGRAYYPDVLVERSHPKGDKLLQSAALVEVKYREQIKADWANLKPKFKACRAYARTQGWTFDIATEKEIRTPRLKNAKFLLPYQRREIEWEDQARVTQALRKLGETTPAKLLQALSSSKWEQAYLLPALWYMVARGVIEADLDKVVTMASPIRSYAVG
ncbi:MAG TPA: TnsA endonuclease N-terminal domain-containing protein [Arenimonas sp.]|uniref:TnsA endonuclease N-terminal domain-containing protein n=1 Tax=Arenimonas sp. TaxID=1872635 RepID=UPI002D80092C|nr:TnsA endonuclease N-terminal domain-containing protein [Arenimonas sp.]HEU0153149.1 TnsA endonuclease N-terminal domain-containing protein [Arenimonas sp.]